MWRNRATTKKNGELPQIKLAHRNCCRIRTVARILKNQAPLERTRAGDYFPSPVCCVNLPMSRDTRVAVRAFHQTNDDEERTRRCDDAIAIDEGKAEVVMLLRIFCGTNSSTWQFLSFVAVDTSPIFCTHSELDIWRTHSEQLGISASGTYSS